ncbi:MAG: hypothetical protein ACYDBJ_08475 [Aggregatilineales bacterium]
MIGSVSVGLGTLLTDQPPESDVPLIVCDAELDAPLHYIFESDGVESWTEAIGAGRQLAALPNQLSAALPTGSVILQADSGRIVALVPDSAEPGWTARLARILPEMTGIVTLGLGVMRLTTRQIFGGLYRAPENVIGIPGMTVHQARVNRYYHVESPSTVPPADRIAARRHFGEAVGLVNHLARRACEERTLVPFYECLPLVERCTGCRVRPAEPAPSSKPLCGICRRKREAAGKIAKSHWAAVIGVRLPNADRLLLDQRTPGAYKRMATTIAEAWHYALFEAEKCGAGVKVLWQSGGAAWLIAPATEALAAAKALCRVFAAARVPGNPSLCVGIALGEYGARTLYTVAHATVADALADSARSGNPGAIRVRLVHTSGLYEVGPDTDGLRYTTDTLDRLHAAATNLATHHFPIDAFSELPDLLTRQTAQAAALYFDHTRTRLDDRARRLLDPLIGDFGAAWGAGTARYFRAMADVFGVQALIQQAMNS